MALIELRELSKAYGDVTALAGLDLDVPDSCLYGLLGPNGAGKTTTLRILATLLAPDAGRVCIDGIDALQDPRAVKARNATNYSLLPAMEALPSLSGRAETNFCKGK